MQDDERLMNIEIKLARQEDLVETLNQMVYQQQKKITQLEGLCSALARRMSNASDEGDPADMPHERPPHY